MGKTLITLDRYDRQIVRQLQSDARTSVSDLGQLVGLSTSACSRRLARLERVGAITGYRAILATSVVGAGTEIWVQVTLESQKESVLTRFERAIREVPQVLACDLMAGSVDYSVQLAVADLADYEHLHRHVLSALPGVARIESSVVLRNIVKRLQPGL